MKKPTTELVFILDRSGSMVGLESDTIGGYNAVLKRHQQIKGKAFVSTVLFDHETQVLCDREEINKAKPLSLEDYQVRGRTALLDAVGDSIRHIARVQEYLPKKYKAEQIIFVIITDGLENASRKYYYETVKQMIEERRRQGWEFMFLGANIDASQEAAKMGIVSDRTATYVSDEKGTEILYDTIATSTCHLREAGILLDDWDEAIRKDRQSR